MSDQSDSQNRSEEQMNLSEGTSPSTTDEGSRSTPSNLPKAATRQRRKRTSDFEDEDYKAEEDEATSKKVVLKKEYGSAQSTKPGLKKKVPAKRTPMPKARKSTQVPAQAQPKQAPARKEAPSKPQKVPTGETMKFTIESEDDGDQDKKKKRARTTTAKVLGKPSMRRGSDEEEEDAAPAPKAPKLMGDAIRSGAATSKPKEAPKAASKAKQVPKRNTRSIPAAEKNKAPVPNVAEEEDEE